MGKRLLVLGASGNTGQHLVKQALERDHHVTALVSSVQNYQMGHCLDSIFIIPKLFRYIRVLIR